MRGLHNRRIFPMHTPIKNDVFCSQFASTRMPRSDDEVGKTAEFQRFVEPSEPSQQPGSRKDAPGPVSGLRARANGPALGLGERLPGCELHILAEHHVESARALSCAICKRSLSVAHTSSLSMKAINSAFARDNPVLSAAQTPRASCRTYSTLFP